MHCSWVIVDGIIWLLLMVAPSVSHDRRLQERVQAFLEKENAYRSPAIDRLHSMFVPALKGYLVGTITGIHLSTLADEVLLILLDHEDTLVPTMEFVDALILASQLADAPQSNRQAIHRQLHLFLK